MVASLSNPAALANYALVRMGFKQRVGSLFDGSEAGKQLLDIYSQTRDELLREGEFGFAERDVNMTLLKSAPIGGYIPPNYWNSSTNPPPPWLYEYAYNDDVLKVRAIKQQPFFVMNFNPQPVVYRVLNDNSYTPAQRVIVCNVPSAILTYTAQVTDPETWSVDFVEAFAASLARRLPALNMGGAEGVKMEAADEQQEIMIAKGQQG